MWCVCCIRHQFHSFRALSPHRGLFISNGKKSVEEARKGGGGEIEGVAMAMCTHSPARGRPSPIGCLVARPAEDEYIRPFFFPPHLSAEHFPSLLIFPVSLSPSTSAFSPPFFSLLQLMCVYGIIIYFPFLLSPAQVSNDLLQPNTHIAYTHTHTHTHTPSLYTIGAVLPSPSRETSRTFFCGGSIIIPPPPSPLF